MPIRPAMMGGVPMTAGQQPMMTGTTPGMMSSMGMGMMPPPQQVPAGQPMMAQQQQPQQQSHDQNGKNVQLDPFGAF